MLTKDQLIESFTNECAIAIHLHGKLTAEQIEFRPQAGMRSTLELLRYLSACGIGPLKGAVTGNWELMGAHFAETKQISFEEFPIAMRAQGEQIAEALGSVPDEAFLTQGVSFPWGYSDTLGAALVNCPLKFLTAYRMQLFLYAKLSGSSALNTANLWAGIDMPLPRH